MSGSFESVRWTACVHRLDLGVYSHPKEFWGNRVRNHVKSIGIIPSTGKNSRQRRIEPATLHQVRQRAEHTTNELFRPLYLFVCSRIRRKALKDALSARSTVTHGQLQRQHSRSPSTAYTITSTMPSSYYSTMPSSYHSSVYYSDTLPSSHPGSLYRESVYSLPGDVSSVASLERVSVFQNYKDERASASSPSPSTSPRPPASPAPSVGFVVSTDFAENPEVSEAESGQFDVPPELPQRPSNLVPITQRGDDHKEMDDFPLIPSLAGEAESRPSNPWPYSEISNTDLNPSQATQTPAGAVLTHTAPDTGLSRESDPATENLDLNMHPPLVDVPPPTSHHNDVSPPSPKTTSSTQEELRDTPLNERISNRTNHMPDVYALPDKSATTKGLPAEDTVVSENLHNLQKQQQHQQQWQQQHLAAVQSWLDQVEHLTPV